jgi:hypothetical protein
MKSTGSIIFLSYIERLKQMQIFMKSVALALIVMIMHGSISCASTEKADMVILNGKISPSTRNPYAEAIAIKGELIIAVGTSKSVKNIDEELKQRSSMPAGNW